MSEFIRKEIPESKYSIFHISDMHVGSLMFHEAAFNKVKRQILKKKNNYVVFVGDLSEGKLIDSPHFNPEGLKPRQLDVHHQADYFCELWKPLCERTLLLMPGNHDQYLAPNFDIIRYVCERVGIPDVKGGYQSWLEINGGELNLHHWHGRPTLPRGAKDPIQKEANQKAWLKNRLAPLAGSAHAQYMAHTHALLVVEPIEQYALLNSGKDVKARYFHEEPKDINGESWVHPDARWYVNTGTFRRSGGFGVQDYAEVAGYSPAPIGCTRTDVRNGRITAIEKIIL